MRKLTDNDKHLLTSQVKSGQEGEVGEGVAPDDDDDDYEDIDDDVDDDEDDDPLMGLVRQ